MGIYYAAEAGVRDSYYRNAFLDRAEPGLREMLVGAGADAVPAIVRHIDDGVRPWFIFCCNVTGENNFVADQRTEAETFGH